MTTRISTNNLDSSVTALITVASTPKISNVQITSNAYSVLDDTAVDTAGGFIRILGTNFATGCQVLINNTPATSVTFVSSTEVRAQVPAQSAGTYTLYVVNSDGGVAIRVNGLNYSGVPAWSTTSPLTGGVVNSAISLQLSATSNSTVTYALQAGSSLPAGVTLAANGLISGTVTGITSETTYNFTVLAVDAELQDTARAFSITITASDQFFKSVTTLLSANTPAGTFVADASTNSFAVTVNGDTRPSNFGPYTPGYYSNYFDGTGDYLRVANNAALELGSSDFTIEFWINWVSFQANKTILTKGYGTIYAPFLFYTDVGAAFNIYMSSTGSSFNIANGLSIIPSVVNGTWYHCVLTRSGSNFATYVNGVRSATFTSSSALFPAPTYDLTIAASIHNLGDNPNCYISNLRIVKGTAVYDPTQTTITVPTAPLTAIANTSLLTCQSNRFIDNSTNNFTITRNGDTLISGFDPFLPDSNFAGRGSGFFDGSSDYLTLPNNAAFAFGTGAYTVEAWIYATESQVYAVIFTAGVNGLQFGIDASGYIAIAQTNVNFELNSTTTMPLNQWNHVAVSRNGASVTSIFLNGSRIASGTVSTNYSSATGYINLNPYNSNDFTGYFSNLRVVKGTAVYDPTQTTITVPTTPLTAIANTSLLTLQNNQPNNNNMFLDASTNNFNITRNGNATQGTFSPYGGGWSNFFNGSTDYFSMSDNNAFQYGAGDFALECWVYPPATPETYSYIVSQWFTADKGIIFGNVNGFPAFLYSTTGSNDLSLTSSTVFPVSQWSHLLACRTGNTISLYLNGTRVATTTESGTLYNSTTSIGIATHVQGLGSYLWSGYISNLRSIAGSHPYNAAQTTITVPTAPLTAVANTRLLICADNRFIDDGPSNFTLTRAGTPSVQRFNPFNPVITTPTTYSAYFDGTGDFLSTTGSGLGSGNFTIEMWVYMTSYPNSQNAIYSNGNSDNVNASTAVVYINSSGTLAIYNYPTSITTSTTVPLNQWNHIAVVRNSGTIALYINGTSGGSGANSNNISNSTMQIMQGYGGISASPIGYVSNVRVVVGTAVYTANFTPSTSPLIAIANTVLLTCQSDRFIDNSTNNFTITNNGDTAPRQFNPFGWTITTGSSAAYTPALYGGSAYFDGTGDYLTVGTTSNWNFLHNASALFTIEAWIYVPSFASAGPNFGTNSGGSAEIGAAFWVNSSGQLRLLIGRGVSASPVIDTTSSGSVPIQSWAHIAVTYNQSLASNNCVFYINGVVAGTANKTANAPSSSNSSFPFTINGYGTTAGPACYISDVRVFSTVNYTSNFQPSVAPLTAVRNTVLLNNMTGAGIYDSSMMVDYETNGTSQINTSIKKYGNTSMQFSGSNYLVAASNPVFALGTGNYTIEAWVYPTSIRNGENLIYSVDITGGTSFGFNQTQVYIGARGVAYDLQVSYAVQANTWTHLAAARQSGTVRIFANGTLVGSGSVTRSCPQGPAGVGDYPSLTGNGITGYIDDLRVTRGVARYTTNFTPTVSPFIGF